MMHLHFQYDFLQLLEQVDEDLYQNRFIPLYAECVARAQLDKTDADKADLATEEQEKADSLALLEIE